MRNEYYQLELELAEYLALIEYDPRNKDTETGYESWAEMPDNTPLPDGTILTEKIILK